MKGLYYTRVTEMLGEKFHMDEDFLQKLNPKATFKKAGEKIIVANILQWSAKTFIWSFAHKGTKQLYLFNSRKWSVLSLQPLVAQILRLQLGTYKVTGVAPNHGIATHQVTLYRAKT